MNSFLVFALLFITAAVTRSTAEEVLDDTDSQHKDRVRRYHSCHDVPIWTLSCSCLTYLHMDYCSDYTGDAANANQCNRASFRCGVKRFNSKEICLKAARRGERGACDCKHYGCYDFSTRKRKRFCCDALNHCLAKFRCFLQ
jgi:hypothetical protein